MVCGILPYRDKPVFHDIMVAMSQLFYLILLLDKVRIILLNLEFFNGS